MAGSCENKRKFLLQLIESPAGAGSNNARTVLEPVKRANERTLIANRPLARAPAMFYLRVTHAIVGPRESRV
jgi:hypothetical protein